ncbi:MAG: DUF4260 family protein [Candidatus Dojkabacteria bacterium]
MGLGFSINEKKYMRSLLRLEAFVLALVFSYFSLEALDWAVLIFLLLLLAPDIGMLGYAISTEGGAFTYNLTHHLGLAGFGFLVGVVLEIDLLQAVAAAVIAHSFFDRSFGLGLKYLDSFKHTHLSEDYIFGESRHKNGNQESQQSQNNQGNYENTTEDKSAAR